MNTSPVSLPRLLPVWAGVLLAAFSGILMACAFIPVDWGGCVWIGFLPLLTALWYGRRREGKREFWHTPCMGGYLAWYLRPLLMVGQ